METIQNLEFIETNLEELLYIGNIPEFYIDIFMLTSKHMILVNLVGEILISDTRISNNFYTYNILYKLLEKECNRKWWNEWRNHKYDENYVLLDSYTEEDLINECIMWFISTYNKLNKLDCDAER